MNITVEVNIKVVRPSDEIESNTPRLGRKQGEDEHGELSVPVPGAVEPQAEREQYVDGLTLVRLTRKLLKKHRKMASDLRCEIMKLDRALAGEHIRVKGRENRPRSETAVLEALAMVSWIASHRLDLHNGVLGVLMSLDPDASDGGKAFKAFVKNAAAAEDDVFWVLEEEANE